MSEVSRLENYLARFPFVAPIIYAMSVVAFVFLTWTSIAGIFERRAAVAATSDLLNQLEGRSATASRLLGSDPRLTGSPFLEGPTVTVAGAALLQRVGAAVSRVGGNTLSSQVELQGTQAKAGFISVVASCEVTQPALQKLLYDLEAEMPFLFVDQLVVQVPLAATAAPEGKLRLMLKVSGQWSSTK